LDAEELVAKAVVVPAVVVADVSAVAVAVDESPIA
jgi:hypothetical protein